MKIRKAIIMPLTLVLLAGCFVRGKREKRVEPDADTTTGVGVSCKGDSSEINEKEQEELRRLFVSGLPESGGTLRIHSDTEPPHLQPMVRPDAAIVRMVQGDVFEPLVIRDPATMHMKGALAERWEFDDSDQTYTFYLRQGVTWHDGVDFTAKDVMFTLDLFPIFL